jgi:hypothetical protein
VFKFNVLYFVARILLRLTCAIRRLKSPQRHGLIFFIVIIEIKIKVSKNRNFRKLESLASYARQHLAMNKRLPVISRQNK